MQSHALCSSALVVPLVLGRSGSGQRQHGHRDRSVAARMAPCRRDPYGRAAPASGAGLENLLAGAGGCRHSAGVRLARHPQPESGRGAVARTGDFPPIGPAVRWLCGRGCHPPAHRSGRSHARRPASRDCGHRRLRRGLRAHAPAGQRRASRVGRAPRRSDCRGPCRSAHQRGGGRGRAGPMPHHCAGRWHAAGGADPPAAQHACHGCGDRNRRSLRLGCGTAGAARWPHDDRHHRSDPRRWRPLCA